MTKTTIERRNSWQKVAKAAVGLKAKVDGPAQPAIHPAVAEATIHPKSDAEARPVFGE